MNHYTIVRQWQNETRVEKSRFICNLQKVDTEAEAQEYIKEMKKKYWDATHNCSAYVIGKECESQRSNDDGEPSGTAGLPMLEVLRKNGLYNVVAVVARYFGGIKLGAGGLVRAYTNSVVAALDGAGLAKVVTMGRYSFLCDINVVGKVLNLLYQQKLFVLGPVEYGERAQVNLVFEATDKKKAEEWLTENLCRVIELQEEATYGEERSVVRAKEESR
jgi:uncharacterized YigZ family protein